MNRLSVLMISCVVAAFVLGSCASCATARYPNPKEYGDYVYAIRHDDLDYVRQFEEKYRKYAVSNINLMGQLYNPVELAAISGSNDIMKFLLEKGADPNAISPIFKVPIIFVMVGNKKVQAVKLAIEHGAKIGVYNDMSLWVSAVASGDMQIVNAVLPNVKDINEVDKEIGNALFAAIFTGNMDIFNLLIACQINMNMRDNFGNTPLLYAIGLENITIVERLIELGADTTIQNDKGYDAKRLAEHMGLKIPGLSH